VIKTPDLIASACCEMPRRYGAAAARDAGSLLAPARGRSADAAWPLIREFAPTSSAATGTGLCHLHGGLALTGVLARARPSCVSLPDRSRLGCFANAGSVLWLSNIGYQCLVQWIDVGPTGVSLVRPRAALRHSC